MFTTHSVSFLVITKAYWPAERILVIKFVSANNKVIL
ncbi:hypothetical protein SAMN05216308_1112 [Nitrosospira sp. Nsp13]|nr:hypothetical protein SAMN05216308_1112 [Nitrosospira sp. Nsp13]